MPTIQLKAMTRELCHELYKHWTNDASIYMDMHLFQPYVYDEAAVNRYFDMKGQDASRRLFAIMLGDKVIGELQLKQIDHDKKECSLSIHMQNDAVKGKGYGTQAERGTAGGAQTAAAGAEAPASHAAAGTGRCFACDRDPVFDSHSARLPQPA